MMRVGIVTLPFHFNYGGILQAFALQKAIQNLGFEPILTEQPNNNIKQILKQKLYKRSNIYKFVKENFNLLKLHEPFCDDELNINNINILVVGSDQVWRPDMGINRKKNVDRYFLKTVPPNCIPKIAFAASFGIDHWDFTDIETNTVQNLINEFSYISVRETSGIKLCSQFLRVNNAIQVLDPTMLLEADYYKKILTKSPFKTQKQHCFTYLLDYNSPSNQNIINSLLHKDIELLTAKVERNILKKFFNTQNSIEKWLSTIYYSDLIITDSFHGCVFSILFHKNFYVISNSAGGNTRIQSLLSLFGLNNRLITNNYIPQQTSTINWNIVDIKLQTQRKESIFFLHKALKECSK